MSFFNKQERLQKKLDRVDKILDAQQNALKTLKDKKGDMAALHLGGLATVDIKLLEKAIPKLEVQKAKLELKLGIRKE